LIAAGVDVSGGDQVFWPLQSQQKTGN